MTAAFEAPASNSVNCNCTIIYHKSLVLLIYKGYLSVGQDAYKLYIIYIYIYT